MEAYNNKGGKSLYDANSNNGRSSTVSFLRPLSNGKPDKKSAPFCQWLDSYKHCSVGYITDMDMDDYAEIENAKLLIVTGHSEYWTRQARTNFDEFVNSGKNALLLSGCNMWWHVRYSSDKNQLICY